VFILEETPFDTLDFASEKIGLGGRMAIDATTKIYPETDHEWGEVLESDPDVANKVTQRWADYGLGDLNLQEVDPNLFGYDIPWASVD
jgi:4-hydroxy-3-polyprenylbenzoate decarboxylase